MNIQIHHWTPVRLGDVIRIEHGWPFKSELMSEQLSGRPIVVNIGNFEYTGGFRFESTRLREYRGTYPESYELTPGDMLLAMTCQTAGGEILGVPGRIPDDGRTYLHNQRLGKVRVLHTDTVHLDYLYWLFRTSDFNHHLCSTASGTKILHTSPSRIEAYSFWLPPLPEQRAIASILGALDDKIELNRRMNRTLEEIARAVFQSWFVDFDPVRAKAEGRETGLPAEIAALFPDRFVESELGEIPEGWKVGDIYCVANVVYGAPFKSTLFNTCNEGKPLIRIRDLAGQNPDVWTTEIHPKGHLVEPGALVVGMDGEFRAHLWFGPPAWLNQRLCCFVPNKLVPRAFVHFSIESLLAFFERSKTGTTVIHLGKSDIDTFRVLIPTQRLLESYGKISSPLEERIVRTAEESRTLAALRDALLPKLICGELRMPEAEELIEEAIA